jgi:hypothetical protein
MMMQMMQTIMEQQKQQDKTNNTLIEAIQSGHIGNTTNNNNITNNTQNNNQTINLNLFITEQCKDAMNLSEFIEQFQVVPGDLKDVLVTNNPKALNKIFEREMGKLTITERPMHCLDKKRKKIFVKENDEWSTENSADHMYKMLWSTWAKQWNEISRQLRGTDTDASHTQSYKDVVEAVHISGKGAKAWGPQTGRVYQEAINGMCDVVHLSQDQAREIVAEEKGEE